MRDGLIRLCTHIAYYNAGRAMTQSIPDKAEVTVEFPEKVYAASFGGTARFDAHLDKAGVSLTLHGSGPADTRKSGDLLPNLPSFIRRVCSSFAPPWGVLRTRWV